MVAVSVVIRFVQEFRSTKAAEQLRAMVHTTATVVRRHPIAREISEQTARILGIIYRQWRAERRDIPLQEVVPGDIVTLSAGHMVPADVRLISSKASLARRRKRLGRRSGRCRSTESWCKGSPAT